MELIAETRKELGKKTKNLRKNRKIPAVIFGKGMESQPLEIGLVQFTKAYKQAGETTLIDLNIHGRAEKVLISDVQLHPVTLLPIHASFHKVNLKEKINAQIPVEVIGEDTNLLIKSGAAMALLLINEIHVEALPTDLLHKISVDVANLAEIGQGITVGELNIDREKVKILGLEDDELVVKLDYAEMKEEEVVEEPVSEAEAIAKVQATEELSEEEKAKRAEEEKAAKAKEEKK